MERQNDGSYTFKLNGKEYKLIFEGISPKVYLNDVKQMARPILREYIKVEKLPIEVFQLKKNGETKEKTTDEYGSSYQKYLGINQKDSSFSKSKIKKDKKIDFDFTNQIKQFISQKDNNELSSEVDKYLQMYLTSVKNLKRLNVLSNRRDFTSQLGEWFISILLNGKISENGIQKDWDIDVNGVKIQVKSHSKSITTTARWTSLKYSFDAEIDYLAIVVFDEFYKINELYFISWENAFKLVKNQKHDNVLNWNDILKFKVDLNNVENEIVKIFK